MVIVPVSLSTKKSKMKRMNGSTNYKSLQICIVKIAENKLRMIPCTVDIVGVKPPRPWVNRIVSSRPNTFQLKLM